MALIDVALHRGSEFYTATLIGSSGAAYADDHHNTNLLLQEATTGICVVDHSSLASWLQPQIESFVMAIQRGAADHSIGDMQLAIRISQAARQCCESNRAAKRIGDTYELA